MTGLQLADQGQPLQAKKSEKEQNSLTGTFIPGSLIVLPQETKQLAHSYYLGVNKTYLYWHEVFEK